MQYIISLDTKTNFHFEIEAELVDDEFIDTVKKASKGLFQFEIGVQSTNLETLDEIKRETDFEKLRSNIEKLIAIGNSHIHLDLIAGLPCENYDSFRSSFNDVYLMKPHMLQLGFLKLLKGSGLRERAAQYGIEFHEFSPYEVIKTSCLSYDELIKLKNLEHVLELYYNSGRFANTLDFLMKFLDISPFDFYNRLSDYWSRHGHYKAAKSINELYMILYRFVIDIHKNILGTSGLEAFNELMKLDWLLLSGGGNMPAVIKRFNHSDIKETVHSYIKDNLTTEAAFSKLNGLSFKEALKHIRYEVFAFDVLKELFYGKETLTFFVSDPNNEKAADTIFSIPLDALK